MCFYAIQDIRGLCNCFCIPAAVLQTCWLWYNICITLALFFDR